MANILVVQNAAENTGEIKQSLEPGGNQILTAQSVDSAKALLKAASFDLVICAAYLDNGTGAGTGTETMFDLLDFVKRDPDRRTTPFVVLCCSQSDVAKAVDGRLRSSAMLLGADKCITQEVFNAGQFRIEIDSFLQGRTKILQTKILQKDDGAT
jgi:CheY-like chemotaxis protein